MWVGFHISEWEFLLTSVVVIMVWWVMKDNVPVSEMHVEVHEDDMPRMLSGFCFVSELLKYYLKRLSPGVLVKRQILIQQVWGAT